MCVSKVKGRVLLNIATPLSSKLHVYGHRDQIYNCFFEPVTTAIVHYVIHNLAEGVLDIPSQPPQSLCLLHMVHVLYADAKVQPCT